MKKLKLIIGLMAVMLGVTGCQYEQVGLIPVNIGFKPYIGHDTRVIMEATPFPEDRSFNVWAWEEKNLALYINKETIQYSEQGWNSEYIWPQTALNFVACWPTNIGFAYAENKGVSLSNFDAFDEEIDVLVAKAERVDNAMDRFVTLGFEHILSRVEFRMRQSLSNEMTVRVKRIQLDGFATKGDFNATGNYKWTTSDTSGSYVLDVADESVEINSEPIYMGSDFYVIPQTVRATLTVDFEVKYGEAAWVPLQEKIQNFLIDWVSGTHYTYTINLTDTNLTYTTGISNWNNRTE